MNLNTKGPHCEHLRIGLVYPSKYPGDKTIHFGLGHLASYLLERNADWTITILDTAMATRNEREAFLNRDYDMVGITVAAATYDEAIQVTRAVKTRHPEVPIVFGGSHVTLMMGEIMREPLIDYAVYGEGELTCEDLLKALQNCRKKPDSDSLSRIDGLIFRHGRDVRVNRPRKFIEDLDALPLPARHLYPVKRYPRQHDIVLSRGCLYACAFCATSRIWLKRWRGRSAGLVMEEVDSLIERHGNRPIRFQDACFNPTLDRLNEICDAFLKRKKRVLWSVRGFRADTVNAALAEKMRRAGCYHVAVGVESANPKVLSLMGKSETIEQITAGINCLRQAGIDVLGQFTIGNMGDTLQTVKESVAYAKRSNLSNAVFGTVLPFPNTAIWDHIINRGTFLVEPDCVNFAKMEMSERVLFETPEFKKEDRREAIRLVQEAGLLAVQRRGRSLNSWIQVFLYRLLPSGLASATYRLLRQARRACQRNASRRAEVADVRSETERGNKALLTTTRPGPS